jgi:hypothetical protein
MIYLQKLKRTTKEVAKSTTTTTRAAAFVDGCKAKAGMYIIATFWQQNSFGSSKDFLGYKKTQQMLKGE